MEGTYFGSTSPWQRCRKLLRVGGAQYIFRTDLYGKEYPPDGLVEFKNPYMYIKEYDPR